MQYNTQELEKKAQEAIQQYQIYFPDEFLEAALAEMYKRGYEELTPTIQSLQKQLEEEKQRVSGIKEAIANYVEGSPERDADICKKFIEFISKEEDLYLEDDGSLWENAFAGGSRKDFNEVFKKFSLLHHSPTVPTDSTTPQSTSEGGEQETMAAEDREKEIAEIREKISNQMLFSDGYTIAGGKLVHYLASLEQRLNKLEKK